MSEYEYYEFCQLTTPLTTVIRKEMASLSSRANVTTHGAAYVYNYGDFPGDPYKILQKNFDIFFYIANWGTVKLMFRYLKEDVDKNEIKPYCINDILTCKTSGDYIILEIHLANEDGFGWTEGEGLLPKLLPLYDEIKNQNFQFLNLVSAINKFFEGDVNNFPELQPLTAAQKAFLKIIKVSPKEFSKPKKLKCD